MSFFFGWKLTLLTIVTVMPIILAAGFFRLRHEAKAEESNQEVFRESAKFATESIGAMRTVTALGLEMSICRRYEKLLTDHAKEAWRKSRWSTAVFSLSDSVSLLCMAFVLWQVFSMSGYDEKLLTMNRYGGQLLADHEYTPFNYCKYHMKLGVGLDF